MVWRRRIREKWPYFSVYVCYIIAGTFATIWPSQVILTATQTTIAYLWSGFLLVGGGVSLYGILRDTWAGEILGVPMLASSNAIFGVALLAYGSSSASKAISFIFIAISIELVGRWRDVRKIAKISQEQS